MKFIRYIFWFALFFGIHYLEGYGSIGTLSIAQLWKLPILIALLVGSILSIGKWTKIEKWGYIMVVALFLCPAVLTNPMSVIIYASKELPFFLFFRFWIKIGEKKQDVLWTVLITFAQYICLASLVTLTGLIEPINNESIYYYGDLTIGYYSSVFGGPHPASSYFCIAIIVLLVCFKNGRFKTTWSKIFNIALLIIAWYSLFLTFVRTGWLMALFAVIIIFVDFSKISMKHFVTGAIAIAILGIGITYLYKNNEAFNARLTNRSGEKIDIQGSGRIDFWKTGIEKWSENDIYGLLFGKGYDKVKEDNLRANGIAVFSHNQFIDALTQYGLVGMVLLLVYYLTIYSFIRHYRRLSRYYTMCMAMFVSSMIFAFFQNEMYFIYAVIFSLATVILYYDGRNTVLNRNEC